MEGENSPRQQRQQPVAHPVARHAQVAVRLVLAIRLAAPGQVLAQLLPRHAQERSHDVPGTRSNARQRARTRAADEPQQHGLGEVVARVAGRHAIRAPLRRHPFVDRVAGAMSRVLERDPLRARKGPDVDALDGDRNADRRGQRAAEPLVLLGGLAPEPVVDVDEPRENVAARRRGLGQEHAQRHRVRAAGQGGQNAATARNQPLALDGPRDAPGQRAPVVRGRTVHRGRHRHRHRHRQTTRTATAAEHGPGSRTDGNGGAGAGT